MQSSGDWDEQSAAMPKLFHLSCSPRADSESSAGAKVFIDRFRQARPDWDIDVMNLWRGHLTAFEGYVLAGKYVPIGGAGFHEFPARRLSGHQSRLVPVLPPRPPPAFDPALKFWHSLQLEQSL